MRIDPTNVQFYVILVLVGIAALGFLFSLVATTITGRPIDPQMYSTLQLLIQLAIGVAIGAGSTAYVNRMLVARIKELEKK